MATRATNALNKKVAAKNSTPFISRNSFFVLAIFFPAFTSPVQGRLLVRLSRLVGDLKKSCRLLLNYLFMILCTHASSRQEYTSTSMITSLLFLFISFIFSLFLSFISFSFFLSFKFSHLSFSFLFLSFWESFENILPLCYDLPISFFLSDIEQYITARRDPVRILVSFKHSHFL